MWLHDKVGTYHLHRLWLNHVLFTLCKQVFVWSSLSNRKSNHCYFWTKEGSIIKRWSSLFGCYFSEQMVCFLNTALKLMPVEDKVRKADPSDIQTYWKLAFFFRLCASITHETRTMSSTLHTLLKGSSERMQQPLHSVPDGCFAKGTFFLWMSHKYSYN